MNSVRQRTLLAVIGTAAFLIADAAQAQTGGSFTFAASGGMFFPGNSRYRSVYGSSSEIMWSVGGATPLAGGVSVAAEIAGFSSDGFFDASIDSGARFEEVIIHLGLLARQPMGKTMLLRLAGGINRVHAKERTTSPRVPESTVESGTVNGYYGGIGIEQLLENPHISFFADLMYDYSRSRSKEFFADLGGVRGVLGMNIVLF